MSEASIPHTAARASSFQGWFQTRSSGGIGLDPSVPFGSLSECIRATSLVSCPIPDGPGTEAEVAGERETPGLVHSDFGL